MFHLGFARMTGKAHIVKRRLIEINQWAEHEYEEYTDQQEKLVSKAGPLEIKTGKSAWSYHDDEDGYLTAPPKYTDDNCITVILGASFWVGPRVIEAIDPMKARDGLSEELGDFTFAQWVRKQRIRR
jgi:hypothetical protein